MRTLQRLFTHVDHYRTSVSSTWIRISVLLAQKPERKALFKRPASRPPFPFPLRCCPSSIAQLGNSFPPPLLVPILSSIVVPKKLMAMNSPFDCVLLDLDDTLYPGDTGLGPALRRNIDEFLVAKLGVTPERAAAMRVELFRTHGSSLAGLIALGYDVHPDEYHSYVHGRLPYERIAADPQLARLLQSIPQRKVLFTNSDRAHMKRALERLGIDEAVFDAVICFETMNPHLFGEARENGAGVDRPVVVLKPSADAIVAGMRAAGTNPRRTLFLDDSERNIAAGKALGLRTALVGKSVRSKDADYAVESVGSLRRVIPEIWGVDDDVAGAEKQQPDLAGVVEKKGMRSDVVAPIVIQPPTIQA